MKHFFVSARYKMGIPSGLEAGVAGGLILPSGLPVHTLTRRNFVKQYPHLSRRLLDPQLYLADIDCGACRPCCANLVSYGWFGGDGLVAYDSAKMTQGEWKTRARRDVLKAWVGNVPKSAEGIEDAVRVAITTQIAVGCESIILPSPMTSDPASDYGDALAWLDAGMDIAGVAGGGRPCFASVVLSEACLRGTSPWSNRLLDLVLDQVTAREPGGAYVVIEQTSDSGYFMRHRNTVGALLRLCHELKRGGVERVLVAFAGTAGLLALCAGADAWATEWYRSERRLYRPDFEEKDGRAYPAFYSHALCGEVHLKADMDKIVEAGDLSRISDVTSASKGLLRALAAGRKVSSVPEWAHSPGNITTAREHFLSVAARETRAVSALGPADRREYGRQWLESASRLADDLTRLTPFEDRTAVEHQDSWRLAFDEFLRSR